MNSLVSFEKFSPDLLHSVLDCAPDAMLLIDGSGSLLFLNQQSEKMFGYSRLELTGEKVEALLPERFRKKHIELREKYIKQPVERPMLNSLELYGVTKEGREFPVEIALSPLEHEGSWVVFCSIRDISIRKNIESALRNSLKEKEVLLKEVHHRVKNNLQVISSLINLQSRQLKDERAIALCHDMRTRIQSVALIHEKLYQSEDVSRINFGEYIEGLVRDMLLAYGKNDVRLLTEIEDLPLEIDAAVHCGLILSELTSNSLKYAFTDSSDAEIAISLESNKGIYTLTFSDNGPGLEESTSFEKPNCLGLQLVHTFAEEIDAKITYDGACGACYKISFQHDNLVEKEST